MKALKMNEIATVSGGCDVPVQLSLSLSETNLNQFLNLSNQLLLGHMSESDFFAFLSSIMAPNGGPESAHLNFIRFPVMEHSC